MTEKPTIQLDDGVYRATAEHPTEPAGEVMEPAYDASLRDVAMDAVDQERYMHNRVQDLIQARDEAIADEDQADTDEEPEWPTESVLLDHLVAVAKNEHTATTSHLKGDLGRNRAGYEAIAIEDATAAGHSIDFGGQNYPAK